jgi:hypothetical protein
MSQFSHNKMDMLEHFTSEDKRKVIEGLISNKQVMLYLYEKLFPKAKQNRPEFFKFEAKPEQKLIKTSKRGSSSRQYISKEFRMNHNFNRDTFPYSIDHHKTQSNLPAQSIFNTNCENSFIKDIDSPLAPVS